MKNILYELWYGNICPRTQLTEDDPELGRLQQRVVRHYNTLHATCTNEQKTLLGRYENSLADYRERNRQQSFMQGFRLGARLMLEMLTEQEGI